MNRAFQIVYFLARMFSIPVFNVLTLSVGIQLFGKENWGEYISVSIWVFLISFLAKWSGQSHIIREFSHNSSQIFTLFYSNFIERSVFLSLTLLLFLFTSYSVAIASTLLVILIYVYNSLENLLVYFQKFKTQIVIEIIGFLSLLFGLLAIHSYDLESVIYVFAASFLFRIIMAVFVVQLPKTKPNLKVNFQNLYNTFPFFLIGFSGWVFSKIDIYVISCYFSKKELSEYQILIAFFALLQAFPAYLMMPFNKHLYRLPKKSIRTIKTKLALTAIPVIVICTITIWFILEQVSGVFFSSSIYFIIAASTIPPFLFSIDILQLIRFNCEKIVVRLCLTTAMIHLIQMIILIPFAGLLGVVISVCISQWLYLLLISFEMKKLQFLKQ